MTKLFLALAMLAFPFTSSAAPPAAYTAAAQARLAYASTNVTTAAYVQVLSTVGTTTSPSAVEIFDSSGQTMQLAWTLDGGSTHTVFALVYPGGNGLLPISIPTGSRVDVKAVSGTASSGELDLNFLK